MELGEQSHSFQFKPGNSESANCGSKKGGTAGELLPALVPTVEQSDCGTVNHVVDLQTRRELLNQWPIGEAAG